MLVTPVPANFTHRPTRYVLPCCTATDADAPPVLLLTCRLLAPLCCSLVTTTGLPHFSHPVSPDSKPGLLSRFSPAARDGAAGTKIDATNRAAASQTCNHRLPVRALTWIKPPFRFLPAWITMFPSSGSSNVSVYYLTQQEPPATKSVFKQRLFRLPPLSVREVYFTGTMQ
ncbi:hypothetical protein D3C73_1261640 [compost metagenome]